MRKISGMRTGKRCDEFNIEPDAEAEGHVTFRLYDSANNVFAIATFNAAAIRKIAAALTAEAAKMERV